jgi:type III secretion protein U
MSEKTEEPTEKKIRDARNKGQVAVSQDVSKLLIAIAILSFLFSIQDWLMSSGKEAITLSIEKGGGNFIQSAGEVFSKVFSLAMMIILGVIGIAFFLKIIGTWMQTGPLFAVEALKIDFNKFNPVSQLKNIFSQRKLYEMFNNIVKTLILGLLFYYLIKTYFPTLILLPTGDLDMLWKASAALFKHAINIALVILLVMAVFDFAMQKYFHRKSLMMSVDEVHREYKESEGDPHMKGHLGALRQEILESEPEDLDSTVKQADAVVVNPTHFAVALYYRPDETPLPQILCKGCDDKAKEIIALARKHDKPIVRYVWLARTLYAHKGQYIPKPTLQAVAALYQALKPMLEDDEDDDAHDSEHPDETIEGATDNTAGSTAVDDAATHNTLAEPTATPTGHQH